MSVNSLSLGTTFHVEEGRTQDIFTHRATRERVSREQGQFAAWSASSFYARCRGHADFESLAPIGEQCQPDAAGMRDGGSIAWQLLTRASAYRRLGGPWAAAPLPGLSGGERPMWSWPNSAALVPNSNDSGLAGSRK